MKQNMSMSQYYGINKRLEKDYPGFRIIGKTIEIGERAKGRQPVWLNYGNSLIIWQVYVDFTINQIETEPKVFL
jgi:hypothetical protein